MPLNLKTREKAFILSAVFIVVTFLIFEYAVLPFIENKKNIERKLSAKTQTLEQVLTLQNKVARVKRNNRLTRELFTRRKNDFSLFAFLDKLAGQVNVKDHITYMKPSAVKDGTSNIKLAQVEMELKGISTKQLVSYLYEAEASPNMVFVKRLAITKEGMDKRFINVVLHFEAVKT